MARVSRFKATREGWDIVLAFDEYEVHINIDAKCGEQIKCFGKLPVFSMSIDVLKVEDAL